MFASYRRVLAAPGALAFTLTGLLGRLALSMTGVSTVAMIAARRDSYALAGTVSAAGLVTAAVGLPLVGRLVDRYGQARATVPAVLGCAVPLAGLLLCVHLGAPDWTLYVCWAACSFNRTSAAWPGPAGRTCSGPTRRPATSPTHWNRPWTRPAS